MVVFNNSLNQPQLHTCMVPDKANCFTLKKTPPSHYCHSSKWTVQQLDHGPVSPVFEGPLNRLISPVFEGLLDHLVSPVFEGPFNRPVSPVSEGPLDHPVSPAF